jgi:site-specific recombinase XerC
MATEEQSLESLVAVFLADLAHTNHSPQTLRAYAADLAQLCAFHQGPVKTVTAEALRVFFGRYGHLRPATRARKQAAVARFLTWAEQHDLLEVNPMRKIDRVKLDPPQPRGLERSKIERILEAIPVRCLRDRLFSSSVCSWKLVYGLAKDFPCMWRTLISRLTTSISRSWGKAARGEWSCSTIHVWCTNSEPI